LVIFSGTLSNIVGIRPKFFSWVFLVSFAEALLRINHFGNRQQDGSHAMNKSYREVCNIKTKHTAIAMLIAAASLSLYASDSIIWGASKSRADYDAWLKDNKPASVEELLKGPAFPPTDESMFLSKVYPSNRSVNPAAPPIPPITEQQLRMQVSQLSGQAGLKVMDDPAIQAKTQDLRLRAALATTIDSTLGGTVDAIKSAVYSSVAFGHLPTGDSVAAHVIDDGTGHFKIIINENCQHEDIRLLGILLGHEVLHQDARLSVREELIAHTFEILAYARHVIRDPMLASQGTALARFLNTVAMGLLNSRQSDGLIHLLEGRDEDIWPGSNSSVDYLAQKFVEAGLGLDTPGNEALLYSMRKLTGNKKLAKASFDDDTLILLDKNINALLSPEDWIALAEALKLDTGN
jgi:hypothetical protein